MQELIIIGVVAVLLFGRKLPDVAKSLGKSYAEFRRGLSDIQSEMDVRSDIYSATSDSSSDSSSYSSETSYDEYDDYDEATAPMFEPPPAEPQQEPSESDQVSAESGQASTETEQETTDAEPEPAAENS